MIHGPPQVHKAFSIMHTSWAYMPEQHSPHQPNISIHKLLCDFLLWFCHWNNNNFDRRCSIPLESISRQNNTQRLQYLCIISALVFCCCSWILQFTQSCDLYLMNCGITIIYYYYYERNQNTTHLIIYRNYCSTPFLLPFNEHARMSNRKCVVVSMEMHFLIQILFSNALGTILNHMCLIVTYYTSFSYERKKKSKTNLYIWHKTFHSHNHTHSLFFFLFQYLI